MNIYTDSIEFASGAMPGVSGWDEGPVSFDDPNLGILADNLYHDRPFFHSTFSASDRWKYLFIVRKAHSSHFDLLVRMNQEDAVLPDGLLCLAGSGAQFHGQRGRPWVAMEGNIHLAVHLTPRRKIDHFGVAFTILSAVACVDAIDMIEDLKGRANLKWVNDIIVDGAKVGGVLTHTQSVENIVSSAVLGIGLNVESRPEIGSACYLVTSLLEKVNDTEKCSLPLYLNNLLETLDANYRLLLDENYRQLLDKYRRRSVIIGREIQILSDPTEARQKIIAHGTVTSIGENLEIYLENRSEPVTKGCLIIKSQ